MAEELQCTSCKKRIGIGRGTTQFLCPNCGKHSIVRCGPCRQIVVKYTCPGCEFEGPN